MARRVAHYTSTGFSYLRRPNLYSLTSRLPSTLSQQHFRRLSLIDSMLASQHCDLSVAVLWSNSGNLHVTSGTLITHW